MAVEDSDTGTAKPEQALSAAQNPYAPPSAGPPSENAATAADLPHRDAKPFTTLAVGVATFFGSALAGTVLMYLSLSRLGRVREARRAALLGGGLTLGTLVAAIVLPLGIGNAVPIGVTIAMVMLSRQMLDPFVEPHLARGGRRGSGWSVTGISLVSAFVVFGALIGLTEGLGVSADDYVESAPGHRVIYERGASEGEARQVADTLEANGVFPPGGEAEVVLRRNGAGLELQVVLEQGWEDPPVAEYYAGLAQQLETRTGRTPFVILLCNDFLLTKHTVSSAGP